MRKPLILAGVLLSVVSAIAQTAVVGPNTATQIGIQPGTAATTSLTGSLNGTRLFDFVAPSNGSFGVITYKAIGADATGNLYGFGIYTTTGALMCSTLGTAGTVSFPSANTAVSLNMTSRCNLTQGTRYLFAWTGPSATGTLAAANIQCAQANTVPSSGSATTNGVLNAAITPPADSWANCAMPNFSLHN